MKIIIMIDLKLINLDIKLNLLSLYFLKPNLLKNLVILMNKGVAIEIIKKINMNGKIREIIELIPLKIVIKIIWIGLKVIK